ncbi:uncharacterized protein BYT42DRAFT_586977 [Radiomyces spectabilis]|uniref:uncharacterized protein n=1 Tax=Radiomyces spectabilis TaxID=64574 RepID=UPI00221FCD26|nr:uncharacterized protein BYT42DRAFT_586977 [Radiomyces spectabilis]KAI8367646.1 hypothetical protein BYT42DRAFT_586977 [Radiomyces spectabilis]
MVQPIASSQSQIVDSASDDTYDPAETNGRKNSKSSSASSSSTSMDEEKKSRNLYKTELCRNWREKGQCKYGPRCQYAHGPGDLRKVERHPKYKTQLCRTFQQTGSCPYGGRCMFKHQEETSIAKSPVLCHKTNSVNRQMTTPSPVSENSMSNSDTEEDEDDMLMLPNPESLLPQQLLTEIENEPTTSTARVCPLRQYVDISALSKMTHPLLPSYNPHTSSSVATVERCRAFLSPWLL